MKTIKQYDFVILDFDGTICDLNVDWAGLKSVIYQQFAKRYNWDKPLKLMEMINIIYQKNNPSDKVLLLSEIRKFEMDGNAVSYTNVNINLLDSVEDFYIISNNLNETINIALRQMQVANKCKAVIGIDDVIKSKPNINPFNILCSLTGSYRKESYIMIGDTETDQLFAEGANIDFKHINNIT